MRAFWRGDILCIMHDNQEQKCLIREWFKVWGGFFFLVIFKSEVQCETESPVVAVKAFEYSDSDQGKGWGAVAQALAVGSCTGVSKDPWSAFPASSN